MPDKKFDSDIEFRIETTLNGVVTHANECAIDFYQIKNYLEKQYHISEILEKSHQILPEEIERKYLDLLDNDAESISLSENQNFSKTSESIIWSYRPGLRDRRSWWMAMEKLPISILLVTVDGKIIAHSVHAEAQFAGHDLSELDLLFSGYNLPVHKWLTDLLHDNGGNHMQFVHLPGEPRHFQLQATASLDPDLLIIFAHDVTEMRLLERQFLQSQKMQAIGQLAGGIAHDFNNLLTAISGHCDLLLLKHKSNDPSYDDLNQIHHNTNRAAALVRQLLAFSRKQTLEIHPVDIDSIFDDMAALLRTLVGDRARISFIKPKMQLSLAVDRHQLEQSLVNLVINARDAIDHDGSIRLSANPVRYDTPQYRDKATIPLGNYVEIKINDNGTGISDHILTSIFEPFFTTKGTGEGTGLGLSMVYGFVKQSGGFIFVDSKVGIGTSFTLLFPAHMPIETEFTPVPNTTPVEKNIPPQPKRILLVEDELPVRKFAIRALQQAGHTALEAHNAEEAIALLKTRTEDFALMISDVIMPGSQDISWVETALELQPNLPIVFVSGYPEETFSAQRKKLPKTKFLPKPYSLKELVNSVNAYD